MTTIYRLVALSRNVKGVFFGKYSGYALVKYEDGNPVVVKTVEVLAAGSGSYMNFISSDDVEGGYADGWFPINSELSGENRIVPSKVYENGQWITPTSEWLEDREYKTVELKNNGQNLANPEDLYEQIETNAKLLDQFKCIRLREFFVLKKNFLNEGRINER